MRSLRFLLPAAITVALVVAGCGGGGSKKLSADSVAVVGSDSISRATFDSTLDRVKRSYATQKRTFPKAGTAEYQSLVSEVVKYLVQVDEFDQKAAELKVSVTPKQVDDRLAQIKKQSFGGNEKKYQQALKQQGLTEADLRQDLHAQLTSQAIYAKLTSSVKVSDSDIKAYYDAHKAQYVQPETREVRHVLVKTKALADQLYQQLKSGKDSVWCAIAKKYSQDPGSKARGGDLGTISKGQTVPAFDTVAFTLPTKAISTPIHTQYGYHIIEPLSDVHPQKTTPLASVKASIQSQLLQQKKNDVMTKWVAATTKSYCSSHSLKFAPGFTPNPDPCTQPAKTTTT